ncbi:MAG: molecular chaperone DnaJ [Actinobacteria bacterium]|nr:molecular chaperone DnaJ [Actinomycetota bacterium]
MAPQREWFEKDYYAVLGVDEGAAQKDITRAYRKLARQHHPDANSGNAASEERFKQISAAYDVIGDPDKRKEYDEVRKLGPLGAMGFGGGGAGAEGFGPGGTTFTFNPDDVGGFGDLGSILGGLFGRRGGGSGPAGATRGNGPRRGRDLEAELHLSFADAVSGVTTSVHLTSDAPCSTCAGSGAKPGTSPIVCPRCAGRGTVQDDQGLFSFSSPCPRCAGRGMVVEDPCPTCRGTGVERRPREVRVRVPPGVTDGRRIRLKGRGTPGAGGGPPGDLYVTCRVAPHELFSVRGRDLVVTVPVTFPEAALGADISVPTLDGAPVTLRLPPGTRSGRTFRVRGRGVPSPKGDGDLLVTVEVAVPAKLTAAQRKAIQALDAATDANPREHLMEAASHA